MRPMEQSDLWYSKRDISSFRKMVRYDDEQFNLTNMMRRSKNALVWFQMFGKVREYVSRSD